jgi:hypothetical protein
MADKFIPGMQFQDWNSIAGSSGGLGSVAALFLANQMGLVDLNDKTQQEDMQKHGLLGGLFKNKMMGQKPEGSAPAPGAMAPIAPMGNDQLQQAMDMNAAPAGPVAPTAPQAPMAGMPDMSQYASYDPDDIDSSLSNFAKLLTLGRA